MKSTKTASRAGRKSLLAGASLLAGVSALFVQAPAAYAQDAQADSDDTIIVTGSRIARRDAVAESPIFSVEHEDIVNSGHVTLDHYLNTLPQITPSLSSQSNNPSSNGRAFIDLRGLGTNRNLILIDGRRGMGSTSGGVVDVNTIPAALIERVEVITGGAAATYGADAVSGVVNFIMRDSYDGIALDTQYRITERGDGKEWGGDITFGGDFADGRGSAVFNASYFNREAMYKDAREFSAQASSTTSTFPGGGWSTGATATQPSQAAVNAVFGANTCNRNGGTGGFGFNPDGSLFCTGVSGDSTRNVAGYTGPQEWIATKFYPDLFSYNFEPDNILVLPMERWNIYSHFELDLADSFRPYATAIFTNYNALQELAPTPAAGSTGFTVPVTNPFIPSQLATLLASRTNSTAPFSFSKRFNDLGGRTGYNTHDVWQMVVGAEGDLAEGWSYDIYASYGRSVQNEIQGGNVRRDRVQSLLDAPTIAAMNTVSGGACPTGLNLFGNAPITPSCAAWISLEAKNLTTVEQRVVEGTVSGDLFELPAGTLQIALGAGYRDLSFDFKPDGGLQPGLVAGFNQQLPVSGELDHFDIFGEALIPIVRDLPLIDSLSLTTGYRTTDSNQSGRSESWKVTYDWSIVDWLRGRGGMQRAVRSPNINELYAPQLNNFPSFTNQDPCNTTGANSSNAQFGRNGPNGAAVQALCAAQSAVAGGASFNQPFGQATGLTGGNPNLEPETADSFTVGFVANSPYTNDFLSRLYVSVDYWSIELENQIGAFGASTIVQRCFNRDNANPTYSNSNAWCQLFTREPSNGGVINLQQIQSNRNVTNTSGVDLAVGWSFDLQSAGALDFDVITTWVESYENGTAVTPNDPVYEYVGTIGSGTGSATPEWRATINTAYTLGPARLNLTARWIDAMTHANVVTGGSPISNTGVDETWYVDLRGSYDLTENVTLRAGVNNLLDQEPQLYSPNIQANTDPSTYDVLGRRFFVGVNLRM